MSSSIVDTSKNDAGDSSSLRSTSGCGADTFFDSEYFSGLRKRFRLSTHFRTTGMETQKRFVKFDEICKDEALACFRPKDYLRNLNGSLWVDARREND